MMVNGWLKGDDAPITCYNHVYVQYLPVGHNAVITNTIQV